MAPACLFPVQAEFGFTGMNFQRAGFRYQRVPDLGLSRIGWNKNGSGYYDVVNCDTKKHCRVPGKNRPFYD
jgi:hypothetical protein